MRWLTRLLASALAVLTVALLGLGISGFIVYTKSSVDAVKAVDAIVVLGGEHDGRDEYGIELAKRGISTNLIISNPYWSGDKKIATVCATKDPRFTVTCIRPSPETTRGEALFTRELAAEHGWDSVLVISWRYHLPRARYIFSKCFDGEIIMRPVPREYSLSLAEWEYIYLYQTIGFIKALFQGNC